MFDKWWIKLWLALYSQLKLNSHDEVSANFMIFFFLFKQYRITPLKMRSFMQGVYYYNIKKKKHLCVRKQTERRSDAALHRSCPPHTVQPFQLSYFQHLFRSFSKHIETHHEFAADQSAFAVNLTTRFSFRPAASCSTLFKSADGSSAVPVHL